MSSAEPDSFAIALKALRHRSRSAHEIAELLRRKDVDQDSVQATLAKLTTLGYLNDDALAERTVERLRGDGVGNARIVQSLAKRGLTLPEDSMTSDNDESTRALTLLRRKFPDGTDRGRAGRFLVAKGFEEEAVIEAVDQFCDDEI